ncbi:acyl-CoA dehydrogenase family protein [Paraburkholderia sediminicola]|uniref:acyl-CoA dehydrogenase family protein n=1 Tax=Paraburkholderia sediminicola TaxID=458836 RepID=UPI000E7277B5
MNFVLSEFQLQLEDSVRRFARKELPAIGKWMEETAEPSPPELVRQFADMGWLGMNLPVEYGGQGAQPIDALIVLEELAKISPAAAFPVFESCFGPILAICHFGPIALRELLVPKVVAGEHMISVSMSEPQAGSALTELTTKAVRVDGGWRLSGQKRWCSGAGHAEGYVVYCRMSEAPGAKGIGAVYVERDTQGFSFGKQESLMGFRGIPSADMYFDDVFVPEHHVVVESGGFTSMMRAFNLERCANATMGLGVAQGAFDYALEYVQDRRQFGKPIIDFQAVQIRIADMAVRLDAARLLIRRAATSLQDGFPSVRDSSMAKCFSNEVIREIAGNALQIMGAYGYSKEYPIEQRLRDAWGWGIAGGAIDIQKVNIAAEIVGRRFDQRR